MGSREAAVKRDRGDVPVDLEAVANAAHERGEPHPDDLRSKRIVLTRRGVAAVAVIRDAVAEMEAAWAQQLGPKRFALLRNLLLELQQPA